MSEMAKTNGSSHELDIRIGRVFTKSSLHRGTRYGPYQLKWTSDPIVRELSWEVSNIYFQKITNS